MSTACRFENLSCYIYRKTKISGPNQRSLQKPELKDKLHGNRGSYRLWLHPERAVKRFKSFCKQSNGNQWPCISHALYLLEASTRKQCWRSVYKHSWNSRKSNIEIVDCNFSQTTGQLGTKTLTMGFYAVKGYMTDTFYCTGLGVEPENLRKWFWMPFELLKTVLFFFYSWKFF